MSKILVVDDEVKACELLKRFLQAKGHEAVTAGNGVEALEKLKSNQVDLIITDILMPEMDGFQLCRECKTNDKLRQIPFIFYTATYISKKDEEFALNLGAEKFIVKPLDLDKLLKILEDTIKGSANRAPAILKSHIKEKKDYLAEYNKRLITKLEKKVLDLEKEIKVRKKMEEDIKKVQKLESLSTLAGGIAHDSNNFLAIDNLSRKRKRRYDGIKLTHNTEPDYQKERLEIPPDVYEKIITKLVFLYGKDLAYTFMPELERICKIYYTYKTEAMIERDQTFEPKERFTEEDVILITYGDLIREDSVSPLATLSKFCGIHLKQTINTLHILPFFPYSSDRGFSVIDFETVDPRLGTWEDVEDLETRYKLMFDGVINHVSSKSRWFQKFQEGSPHYKNFFISYDSYDDLTLQERSLIFRPRTTDILTEFHTISGEKYVWSTFSKDQIDLNYKNPEVLIKAIEILLLYVRKGADIIRLDAVTFLWATPGTSCSNLEQTHMIVKIFHDILNLVAPHVALITETNIPHSENISYFGNGNDEVQMVYNFALPPLLLHTFYTKDTTKLSEWAASLNPVSETTTYFNFLDSHDGVGLMAVKDILSHEEINFIIQRAREHGGYISYKTDKDGNEVPYEINITWFSALNRKDTAGHLDCQVKIFLASRAIALVLKGVPGIYLHSFFGTKNDIDAVIETGTKRDINRTVINYNTLIETLDNTDTLTSKIIHKLNALIIIRTKQNAFHPRGSQFILKVKTEIFAVLRTSPDKNQQILSLINITDKDCHVTIPMKTISIFCQEWYELISQHKYVFKDESINLTLKPYDVVWLERQ